jgi:carboxyl-terminal processing protease
MKRMTLAVIGALWMAATPVIHAQDQTPPAANAPTQAAAEAPLKVPQAELEKLLAAYAVIKRSYVGTADDKTLFDGAMAGMLSALDAHSSYLNKDAMRDIGRENTGEYVGVGIEVEGNKDQLRVVAASPDSPAERAGIKPGDTIVSIDGTPVAGLSNEDVATRMHGAPGSAIAIGLTRNSKLETLHLTREALHNDTVHLSMAAPGLAWIRVAEFGGATGADLVAALKQVDAKGAPRGVILDLRNDPGGLVSAGVAVAGAFLAPGTELFSARGRQPGANAVVTVDSRYYRGENEPDVLADLPAWTRTVPLTVLVNGASASAAELVTGALQDQHRATVVGTRTFGKGSIQSVIPLGDDSGIKFTVARYFTPAGHEIQARGITPDIVVTPAIAASDDLMLREADLTGHLAALQPLDPAVAKSQRDPIESSRLFGTRDDKTLQAAVAVLTPADQRNSTLTALMSKLGKGFKLAPNTASVTPAALVAAPTVGAP